MSPRMRVFPCWSCLALALGVTSAAAASEPELDSHTRTAARALAAQGSQSFDKRDYQTALDLFHRAFSLIEAPTIALMEARTLVQLGRWVEAADRYAAVQKMQSPEPNNSAFSQAVDAATQELALLMPRIPTLKVSLRGAGNEPLEVSIDDRKLVDALVGVENPVDPGAHRVRVRRSSGGFEERNVSLKEGQHEEVSIELEPPVPRAPRVVAARSVDPSSLTSDDGLDARTLGYVALGGGAAAALFGTVTGVVALNAKSELDRACTPGCPASEREALDRFRLNRTLSYVGFGVGVAGVGVGSYLLWTTESEHTELALGVVPGGVTMHGAF